MQEIIKAGSVLIKDGTTLPKAICLESDACSPGWRSVRGVDGYALNRKIHNTGWHLFYFAGETQASVLGGNGNQTVLRAIEQILASLAVQKFNCLEITRIVTKRFLGVQYTSVSVHPRNMQESMFLVGDETRVPWQSARVSAA